jgi:hypothetical protein
MSFAAVPATAAWHHRGARSGFEVVYFDAHSEGCRIEGWTTAIEDGATSLGQPIRHSPLSRHAAAGPSAAHSGPGLGDQGR